MAYSVDLRERVLANLDEESMRATAKRFRMSLSSVYRIQRRYAETGQVHTQRPGGRLPAIDRQGETWVTALINQEPDLTLAALCERYEQLQGRAVSTSAMDRTLKRLKLSRKKRRSLIRSGRAKRSNSNATPTTRSVLSGIPTA
jgi:putative transposase